ncbi:MAG TPA: hypothetical protein VG736_05880 [Vicinamibacterales bacterium]|nr:hypothetical protein [Vicinamibacterales bacterium]
MAALLLDPAGARVRDIDMRQPSLVSLIVGVGALVLAAAGCGPDPSTLGPSDTTNTSVLTIHVYAGPIDPGGTIKYLETLDADSTLQVMLAGEQLANPTRTISVPLRIDISNWDGSLCTPLVSNVVEPVLQSRLQQFLKAGTYCVQVSDPGTLTQTIGAIVRISYPVPTLLPGTTSPVTFASTLAPGGVTTKTFVTSTNGTIAVSLDSFDGGAGVTPRLAIGVVGTDATACRLTTVVDAVPGTGPQIIQAADAGIYCAGVIDPGTLTTPASFSLTIAHP